MEQNEIFYEPRIHHELEQTMYLSSAVMALYFIGGNSGGITESLGTGKNTFIFLCPFIMSGAAIYGLNKKIISFFRFRVLISNQKLCGYSKRQERALVFFLNTFIFTRLLSFSVSLYSEAGSKRLDIWSIVWWLCSIVMLLTLFVSQSGIGYREKN